MNAVTDIVAGEAAGLDPDAPDLAPHDPAIERAQARLRDLEEVREICMSIARVVQKQALAQGDLQDVGDTAGAKEVLGSNVVTLMVRGDFGLVIERVAKAVRLTVMLEEKEETIIRDLKAGVIERAVEARARRRRGEVERVMMAAIHDKHRVSESGRERDRDRLYEHLDREDFDERPVSEIVRRLCDMIGLRPDWKRWADEAWAEEEAQAGVPGTPYEATAAKAVNPKAAAGAKPRAQTPDSRPRSDSS